VIIDHRAFPLELFNQRPTPKALVDAEVTVIGSHDPALQWRAWSQPDATYPSSTLLPLAAVQAAKAGGLAASEQLDAALRHAWWVESRSIHIYAEVIKIAESCDLVDPATLTEQLPTGLRQVLADWRAAERDGVRGSPHLFLAGFDVHNPGITMHKEGDRPVIDDDNPAIYDEILKRASAGT
jgi:hypothetical protein